MPALLTRGVHAVVVKVCGALQRQAQGPVVGRGRGSKRAGISARLPPPHHVPKSVERERPHSLWLR